MNKTRLSTMVSGAVSGAVSVVISGAMLSLAATQGLHADEMPGSGYVMLGVGHYQFDNDLSLDDDSLVSIGAGYNFTKNIALEFSYAQADADPEAGGSSRDFDLWHLDAVYNVNSHTQWIPYLALGLGDVEYEITDTTTLGEYQLNVGAGLKYYFSDNVGVRADMRTVNWASPEFMDFAFTLSVMGRFGGESGPVDRDSDGDGVLDSMDQCPETKLGVEVDAQGCEIVPVVDTDGDGVSDDMDKCPETPQGMAVDETGCLVDSDKDGVADINDTCPETPAGAPVDDKGCPKDSDGDGVADYKDQCPNTDAGAKVDANGCYQVLTETVELTLNLVFPTNSAQIQPAHVPEINKVAEFLKSYPKTTAVLEGHTDSLGNVKYNEQLSMRRASAVRDYLVSTAGIDASRLFAKGYGPHRPVADNSTRDGRQRNRRVVAVIRAEVSN